MALEPLAKVTCACRRSESVQPSHVRQQFPGASSIDELLDVRGVPECDPLREESHREEHEYPAVVSFLLVRACVREIQRSPVSTPLVELVCGLRVVSSMLSVEVLLCCSHIGQIVAIMPE